MANGTMDRQQIAEEKRKRNLAIIKASNQMLEEAKKTALEHNTDPVKRAELEEDFGKAIEDNRLMASRYLNATMEEVENATFREADESEVKKYNERLKKLGVTDEEMHRKSIATVTVGKNGETVIPRRRRRGAKKDVSDIERIENEDEIMKQTMVTNEKQIEENKEKNRQIEEKILSDNNSIIKNFQKGMAEELRNKKISQESSSHTERVELKNKNKEEKIQEEVVEDVEVKQVKKKTTKPKEIITYDFDFSSVPSYVQYDVLPLPSNGQCYPKSSPLRCGRIPVAYLTAADENIISSPNVYRDGKLLDMILSRKILDNRIDVNELCSGDRDAIILWLRATSYGEDFPISVTNPNNKKRYNITIKLSQFDYNDFKLESDDDGLFDYTTNNGDVIKFKYFTYNDEEKIRNTIAAQLTDLDKFNFIKYINNINKIKDNLNVSDEELTMINEDIDEIKDIIGMDVDEDTNVEYPNIITEQMISYTISVNGNTDREYIKNYIENMRTKTAMDYRNYFNNNRPGVDFNFTVNIPESDGGGSFNSFLRLDDTVFINF